MALNGEPVIVSRKENINIVIISEAEYNELAKIKHNAEYLAKLDKSFKQFEDGKTISLSMEELRNIESGDWKSIQKVLDWMKRMEQENE